MGMVFDIKRFAIHDGPGIRTTVFFKGCPLRCALCHNPESQACDAETMYRKNRCRSCGDCVEACVNGAIKTNEEHIIIDPELCVMDMACADACVSEAIEIIGKEMTAQRVMEKIGRDTVFYDESGGGATFSGGEPLAQAAFLMELLDACRHSGIHTAVDTCGHADPDTFGRVAEKADLFLYDLKLMDEKRHEELTGVPNGRILENIRFLADAGKPAVIRVPVLPGINDDDENIQSLGNFAASLPAKPYPVELLSFHRAGMDKYENTNRKHPPGAAAPPSQKEMERIAGFLAILGLEVSIDGEQHERE